MTTKVATYLGKKMLNKEMDKYKSKQPEGPYDPYYEKIPHPTKPNKFKKVKKQIPDYIPSADAEILANARKTAYRLDFCLFNLLGFRFGWSSVIGLAPLVGDGADMALSGLLIKKMGKIEGGLPSGVYAMMMFNMLLDFAVGLVPILGDLADAYLKCNGKNVRLLEEHLDKKYKPDRVRKEEEKLPLDRRPRPATVYEDFAEEDMDRLRAFTDGQDDVHKPQRAYSGRRERLADEEMGIPRHDTRQPRRDRPGHKSTKKSTRR
ncbi:hypothetical protein K491DRAFT_705574 [Lophiostoma macrostomum CBS 122681]|uniref:PH domain-containing protein n=1 Tax=Lophiostoma macrostomum CBS 122681 TaxID=1314788 RepID=A0A6A6T4R8_9PLEO|nr:hypothetical protein K491DRAFT_705574 [Lophiostoma macrostomum CBS 122681]